MNNAISNYEQKQYLWGLEVARIVLPVTLTSGQEVEENTLLAINPATKKAGIAGGDFTDYFGVTMDAINVAADTEIDVIVTGQFRKDALIVAEGHTIDTTKLKAIGLFVK